MMRSPQPQAVIVISSRFASALEVPSGLGSGELLSVASVVHHGARPQRHTSASQDALVRSRGHEQRKRDRG